MVKTVTCTMQKAVSPKSWGTENLAFKYEGAKQIRWKRHLHYVTFYLKIVALWPYSVFVLRDMRGFNVFMCDCYRVGLMSFVRATWKQQPNNTRHVTLSSPFTALCSHFQKYNLLRTKNLSQKKREANRSIQESKQEEDNTLKRSCFWEMTEPSHQLPRCETHTNPKTGRDC